MVKTSIVFTIMLFYKPLVFLSIDLKISLVTVHLFIVLRLSNTFIFCFIEMSNTLQGHHAHLFFKHFAKMEKKTKTKKKRKGSTFKSAFSLAIHFSSGKVRLAFASPYSTSFFK